MSNKKTEEIRNNYINDCNRIIKKIADIKKKIDEATFNNDTVSIEIYQNRLSNQLQRLKNLKYVIEFIREPSYEDIKERQNILEELPIAMRKIIPNNIPVVFHGNKMIGMVREIIKSGGLFTPEQRNVDFNSFATKIDVCWKENMKTSCEFAEQGNSYLLPYGAIFAFLPLEEEIEKVLSTKDNSEVFGGVEGVDFRKEPNRLIGIITTRENIDRIKEWCLEYGWDDKKVFTYDEFIEVCKETFGVSQTRYSI